MTNVTKKPQINQNRKDFELFERGSDEPESNDIAGNIAIKRPERFLFEKKLERNFRHRLVFSGRLFDKEDGKYLYDIFINYQLGDLFLNWSKLKLTQKVSLIKYSSDLNLQYQSEEGEKELNKIITDVIKYNHFPLVIAKLFFDIVFSLGFVKLINEKLKVNSWENLSKDERIVILYDLLCLHPKLQKEQHYIFDIAINEPDYNLPLVVKEINRLAILDGNFESVYRNFRLKDWTSLTTNDKIVLTSGLCEKNRGVTEDLDQVLYNVRVYNEIPHVLYVEGENIAIDRFLSGGPISIIIRMIIDHFNNYGEVISIKGVERVKIQATLERFGSSSS